MADRHSIDLFSGIGGISLACHMAGVKPIIHSEIGKYQSMVLANRFPDVPNVGDVTKFDATPYEGSIYLVAGGTPCQNFSLLHNREGLSGEKSSLFYEYARIVREAKPKWFLWENVPNALRTNGGHDFRAVLNQMGQFGYSMAWRVLDSQYWGVAQRRKRLFLIGSLGDGRSAEVFYGEGALPNPVEARFKTGSQYEKSAYEALGKRQSVDTDYEYLMFDYQHSMRRRQGNYELDISSTINTNCRHYVTQKDTPNSTRKFMPVEWERLQGFPDGWTEGLSDNNRYFALGNSVTVPVVQWIVERMVMVDSAALS